MKVSVTQTVDIDQQTIYDHFVTAIEGGIGYWAHLDELKEVRALYPKEPISMAIAMAVVEHNLVVPVFDAEDWYQKLGEISQQNIQRGYRLYALNGGDLEPEADAESADLLFQYIVLGEHTYS